MNRARLGRIITVSVYYIVDVFSMFTLQDLSYFLCEVFICNQVWHLVDHIFFKHICLDISLLLICPQVQFQISYY